VVRPPTTRAFEDYIPNDSFERRFTRLVPQSFYKAEEAKFGPLPLQWKPFIYANKGRKYFVK